MITCLHVLLVPMSVVLFAPHHAFGCPIHDNTHPLYASLQIDLALLRSWVFAMVSAAIAVIRQLHAPTLRILLGPVELPLDARQKVKVSVDAGRGGKITALDVGGGVSGARTLCPKLVTFCTGKGASLGCAAGTAVFGGVCVTEGKRQRCNWETTAEAIQGTNQILHNSLRRGSVIACSVGMAVSNAQELGMATNSSLEDCKAYR